jgi:hypothetical protein
LLHCHLAFGQLFDVCRVARSSSSQRIHQFLHRHQAAALSSRLMVVGVPWHAPSTAPFGRQNSSIAPLAFLTHRENLSISAPPTHNVASAIITRQDAMIPFSWRPSLPLHL